MEPNTPDMLDHVLAQLNEMRGQLDRLTREAEARRLIGRYMYLCDVPLPDPHIPLAERSRAIAALFTQDAVWEGVGGAHGAQFGRNVGRDAIAEHFGRFYSRVDPAQTFNTHYLCTEQLLATDDGAEGRWVQFQPWADDKGGSLLRSSRLHVRFRMTPEGLRIAHYRTENLFIANLPDRWWDQMISASVLG